MATVTTEIGSQTKKKERECTCTLVEPDFKENGWLANAKAKESTYWQMATAMKEIGPLEKLSQAASAQFSPSTCQWHPKSGGAIKGNT